MEAQDIMLKVNKPKLVSCFYARLQKKKKKKKKIRDKMHSDFVINKLKWEDFINRT